ncbi:MAG: copper amine oxidase N-terminal domain-containing protein [Clostridiales Family XIII bacterium]|jgi:hypothetical protein|nr:copper amine oxidase N-terminal domain-containing protein [Clostridiales Family XIII bacterium]
MKRKALALLVTAAMVLGAAVPAFAAETKELTANYSGITLYVDLEPVSMKDAGGNAVEPFIVEGTTYLPVRGVSEALGIGVEWNGETKTVYIGQEASTGEPAAEEAATTEAAVEAGDEAAAEDATATDAAVKADDEAAAETTEAAVETTEASAETTETSAETTETTAETTETTAEAEAAQPAFVGVKTLYASYGDVTIYVSDQKLSPTDAAGNAVEPFIVEGSTYLPVRAVAQALGLEVSWDGVNKRVYIGEQPGRAEAAEAYAKYAAAEAAINDAGSYEAEIKGSISLEVEGEALDVAMTGAVKQVNHSDTDIEVEGNVKTDVAGLSVDTKVYYRNGFMYVAAADTKVKMALDVEEAIAQATASLPVVEDAIKEGSVDGNTIQFTMDGAKLAYAANSLTGNISGLEAVDAEYEIGDVAFTATIGDDGVLKEVAMKFLLSVAVADGEPTSIDYDLTVSYTKIGDVSITAPTDLASYKELETEE